MSEIEIKTVDDLKNLDRFYRSNFINSMVGSKQASLIGTVGKTHAQIFHFLAQLPI